MMTILLVEDRARLKELFQRELERNGHQLSAVACGIDALAFCQRQAVDAVIIDLPLRDGDGLATISALRRNYPTLKIVALSGEHYANKILLKAQAWGANATLLIPVTMNELLMAVERGAGRPGGQPVYPTVASLGTRWEPIIIR